MAILRTVDVAKIGPNPWRDGRGEATWESLAGSYPLDKKKEARLRTSMLAGGVFEGVIAREADKDYALAFGHHRVQVFKALVAEGLLADGFPLILKDLTPAEMLSHMARENHQEDGHSFLLAVMNPVEALVRAYGSGAVVQGDAPGQIRAPGAKTSRNQIRYAPGFACAFNVERACPYTAATLSEFLGIDQNEVKWALRALAHIAEGHIDRATLGFPRSAVEAAVTSYEKVAKAKEREIDLAIQAKASAAKLARKEGDAKRAADIETARQNLEKSKTKRVEREARAVADNIGQQVNDGFSVREVIRDLADTPEEKAKEDKDETWDAVVSLIKALNQVGRADAKRWKDAKAFNPAAKIHYRGLNERDTKTRRARARRFRGELATAMKGAVGRLASCLKEVTK